MNQGRVHSMRNAYVDPNHAHTRAFVVLPIVLLVGAAVIALTASLFFSARESNLLALKKQRESLDHALEQHGYALGRELKVQTVWSEAYDRTVALDQAWMHSHFGTYLDKILGYCRVYVLSGHDEPVYAYENGFEAPAQSFEFLHHDIADLISAVRGDYKTLERYPVIQSRIRLANMETLEHRAISDVRLVDGRPAHVVVTTIVPDAERQGAAATRPFLMVATYPLDDAFLAKLGARSGFQNLRWSSGLEKGRSSAVVRTLTGAPIGTASWTRDEPGFELIKSMTTGLAVAFMMLLLLATMLGRRAILQSELIEEHAKTLRELNEQLEQRVLERTREMEATLGNISQGVLMLAHDNKVLVSNERAAELLDARSQEDIDALVPDLLASSPAPGDVQEDEKRTHAFRSDYTLDNRRILELARLALPTGGQVVTLTDVTVLKRRQAELESAMEAATAANKTKTQFLSTMSHEMRTPLNGVIGALDLLSRTVLAPDQKRLVETALFSGEALLVHINDVLDFSKMEAGKLELEPAPFDLPNLIETVLRIVEPQAAARDTKLTCKVSTDVPRVVVADAVRVRQILLNLAGNAAKFTHDGMISIDVQRIGGSDELPELEISVTDTGPGIPASKLSSMFQEFSILDASLARREGGTGLGLAICKRLVTAMGGTIGVDSEFGRGSRFWFRVAFAQGAMSETAATTDASANVDPQPIGHLKLLLVDDSTVNRMIGTQMLAATGHTVDTATNGVEAVAKASEQRYDVILMDISMPEMDGLEATQHIRRLGEPFRNVPIVALTANAVAGDRERFLEAGMNDYLTKPYRKADIERVLSGLGPMLRQAA